MAIIQVNQATGYATKPPGMQVSIFGVCPKRVKLGKNGGDGRGAGTN